MIKITIYESKNGYEGFLVEGHAEYSESGQDIVCSAVSGITQTALFGLMEYSNIRFNTDPIQGLLNVCVKEPNHESDVIIQTMKLGVEDIAIQYEKHVKVDVLYE